MAATEPATADVVRISFVIRRVGKTGNKLVRLVAVPVINGEVREDCVFDASVGPQAPENEIIRNFQRYCCDHPVGGFDGDDNARWLRAWFKKHGSDPWPHEVFDLKLAAQEAEGGLRGLKERAEVKRIPQKDPMERAVCGAQLWARSELETELAY